ncbi:hypothetical protein KC19_4G061900 [Ceratodon purpureus]|uniref:Uncharacterized protein n=1 Tax=Ceratodon purpureus TaxID=3225 RepID=A0A8T0I7B8_CERPU|nr:hypothetical protein KC19_4G061900 [Ceratodon purpureus]
MIPLQLRISHPQRHILHDEARTHDRHVHRDIRFYAPFHCHLKKQTVSAHHWGPALPLCSSGRGAVGPVAERADPAHRQQNKNKNKNKKKELPVYCKIIAEFSRVSSHQ